MHIFINIYGQQRSLNNTLNMINNYISNSSDTFHILYTGWEHEEPIFEKEFPNAYINRIKNNEKLIDIYLNKYNDIYLDHTNITNGKNMRHMIYGYYIKSKTVDTINNYIEKTQIEPDYIVTIRTDTELYDNIGYMYNTLNTNSVYIANEPDFDIYHVGSCTDVFCIANKKNTFNIVNQINNLDNSVVPETNFIHPETSFYTYLKYNNCIIQRLPIAAFIYNMRFK